MKTNVKVRLFSVLLTVILCATMLAACGGSKLSGTYRIDGDQIIITYNLLGQEYTWEQSFSQSGKCDQHRRHRIQKITKAGWR